MNYRTVVVSALILSVVFATGLAAKPDEFRPDNSCAIVVLFDYEGLPKRNFKTWEETPERIRFNIIHDLLTENLARTGKRELYQATYPNDYAIFDWMQDCATARQSTVDLFDAYWARLTPEQREISPPYSIWHRPATEEEVEELIVPELTDKFIRRMNGLPE